VGSEDLSVKFLAKIPQTTSGLNCAGDPKVRFEGHVLQREQFALLMAIQDEVLEVTVRVVPAQSLEAAVRGYGNETSSEGDNGEGSAEAKGGKSDKKRLPQNFRF
jgi:hypothetical protein